MRVKALFLVFLVLFLTLVFDMPNVEASPDTFGNTDNTAGADRNTNNYIHGCYATCPEEGTGVSMTAYAKVWSGVDYCMLLYKASDLSFVGKTEEGVGDEAWNWKTLDFVGSPSLTNQEYILCIWAGGSAYVRDTQEAGETSQEQAITYDYDNPPDPVGGDDKSPRFTSVYCTYTPSGAGQELTFVLPETVTPSASLEADKEKQYGFSESIIVTSEIRRAIELHKILSASITPTDSTDVSKELNLIMAEVVNVLSDMVFSKETAFTWLEVTNYETIPSYASLNVNKEINRILLETAQILASMATAMEFKLTFQEFLESVLVNSQMYPTLPTVPSTGFLMRGRGVMFVVLAIAIVALVLALSRRQTENQ